MTPRSTPATKIKQHVAALLDELLSHDGYGDLRVEVRILKRDQKEVILHCGKQYRYVVGVAAQAGDQA